VAAASISGIQGTDALGAVAQNLEFPGTAPPCKTFESEPSGKLNAAVVFLIDAG